MKRYVGISLILCIALLVGTLSGCGYWAESQNGTSPYASAVAMEGIPVVDYTVPDMSANILVDLSGYSTENEKAAAIKGRELPEDFRLVDVSTGETVYLGVLSETVYDEELGLSLGYADFSDFDREGRYYLECDIVGQSYRFDICTQHFRDLFAESYEQMAAGCRAGTLSVADAVMLLEVYEWYSEVFPDENNDLTPDVLADFRTWVTHMEAAGVENEETALYAAFLAKFSYNYQNYDLQYATDCLKRSSTVFGQVQTAIGQDADSFFALTELYRATGLSTYGNRILEYKSFFENNSSYPEEAGYLYGGMTYMVTRQTVDMEMCANFMGIIMNRAEEVSIRYQDMIHPVSARNNGTADLLKHAAEVSCANYVTNNYQYTNIVEEFLHYLMGQNLESVNYYEQDENRAGYLLLLAQLAANTPQQ